NSDNSGLFRNEVWDLAVSTENDLIIANVGLQKFDGNNWYGMGLPDSLNSEMEVEADSLGNIWTSSFQKGIVKIDPWGNWTLFNNHNSGLIGDNQMVHSTRIDKNGYKYFCTNDGGVSIYKGDLVLGIENNIGGTVVSGFKLFQNYPNPFNPSTVIKYQLPVAGKVTLKVYDLLAREVEVLVDKFQNIGEYDVKFDGNKLSSGVYFYSITAGEFNQTKKLILLK
ncbi:MAG TPA: T9SS type A sorting domain-containing protein, partial [Ignavibacteriaceae bacterium]|nr:T9SS type A sorting domain-containing protein [Ignavibacteriaceae bacterium]